MTNKRRETITQEQVFEIADRLASEGKLVSMNSVREIIGGSFTTLGPLIKQWKAERENQVQDIALPDHVAETMKRVTIELWRSSTQKANEEIEEIKADAQSQIDQMRAEKKEYESEVARLEAEASSMEKKYSSFEESLQSSEQLICELKAEKMVLESQVSNYETLIQDLKLQLEQSNTKTDKLQAELVDIAKQSISKNSLNL